MHSAGDGVFLISESVPVVFSEHVVRLNFFLFLGCFLVLGDGLFVYDYVGDDLFQSFVVDIFVFGFLAFGFRFFSLRLLVFVVLSWAQFVHLFLLMDIGSLSCFIFKHAHRFSSLIFSLF